MLRGLEYSDAVELCSEGFTYAEDAVAMASQEELPLYLAHEDGGVRALAAERLREVQGIMTDSAEGSKTPTTRAAVLDWIYNRMQEGVKFAVANKEAKRRFKIIELSEEKERDDGETGANGS